MNDSPKNIKPIKKPYIFILLAWLVMPFKF